MRRSDNVSAAENGCDQTSSAGKPEENPIDLGYREKPALEKISTTLSLQLTRDQLIRFSAAARKRNQELEQWAVQALEKSYRLTQDLVSLHVSTQIADSIPNGVEHARPPADPRPVLQAWQEITASSTGKPVDMRPGIASSSSKLRSRLFPFRFLDHSIPLDTGGCRFIGNI